MRDHLESIPKGEKTVSQKKVLPGFKFLLGKNTTNSDSLGSLISKMGIIIIPLEGGSCGDSKSSSSSRHVDTHYKD